MNVNNNVINYNNAPTKVDTPKQPARKEEFKKALDDQTLKSKSFSNDDVNKTNNKEENLDETKIKNPDETNNENHKDNLGKTTAEEDKTKGLDDVATDEKPIYPLKQNIDELPKNIVVDADTSDKVSTDISSTIEKAIKTLNQNIKELPKDSVEDVGIKINNTLKKIIDLLKQNLKKTSGESASTEKTTDQMAQIQQLLQSLTAMIQSTDKTTTTKTSGTELNSINLEELVGTKKLTPETKTTLKNNLSEILSLLENPKENTKMSSEMLGMLQKLTTQVKDIKSDLNLLKVSTPEIGSDNSDEKSLKDNLIKMLKSQNTKSTSESISKNQNQSSSDNKKDNKSSGNSSSEEKFLNKLLSGDKDDVKISKAVNFMNQFQTVKTSDASKVLSANLVVDKNNFQADVIKSVKFMELNNIKDLTVKMNPRELGEITIKLTMESGIMKASILAQNKETYNLLNNNASDIQDRLKNMDIKIQSLDINVYEDSTFFNKNSSGNNNNNGKQDNNSKTNVDIDDDVDISSNYVIEDNQVNKFV
ncbi:flagellar hook-length control protein FliK [Clostridium estertheticum]|uniref:flagellar hook-length control protein FliK n=1 Tax=Clostridium estertheticum TaxID=238834 RepID=UPI001CF200B2|nr:flagellar hook-length control protein FliK [Clostridium estertheticum]MCB2308778.1 flagellar hook-length control protein FliK [Clostridium estertheticum]MCB2347144.1 flagellar hook-length control protein FliK [Clostridium estertheticum]MCB2351764.1 flagellar hook-length control protein FliK [Clostridium estertheticum]WAG44513.1 flagellar hook-length control protein FliK [Clostridium estertheticum]